MVEIISASASSNADALAAEPATREHELQQRDGRSHNTPILTISHRVEAAIHLTAYAILLFAHSCYADHMLWARGRSATAVSEVYFVIASTVSLLVGLVMSAGAVAMYWCPTQLRTWCVLPDDDGVVCAARAWCMTAAGASSFVFAVLQFVCLVAFETNPLDASIFASYRRIAAPWGLTSAFLWTSLAKGNIKPHA